MFWITVTLYFLGAWLMRAYEFASYTLIRSHFPSSQFNIAREFICILWPVAVVGMIGIHLYVHFLIWWRK